MFVHVFLNFRAHVRTLNVSIQFRVCSVSIQLVEWFDRHEVMLHLQRGELAPFKQYLLRNILHALYTRNAFWRGSALSKATSVLSGQNSWLQ